MQRNRNVIQGIAESVLGILNENDSLNTDNVELRARVLDLERVLQQDRDEAAERIQSLERANTESIVDSKRKDETISSLRRQVLEAYNTSARQTADADLVRKDLESKASKLEAANAGLSTQLAQLRLKLRSFLAEASEEYGDSSEVSSPAPTESPMRAGASVRDLFAERDEEAQPSL